MATKTSCNSLRRRGNRGTVIVITTIEYFPTFCIIFYCTLSVIYIHMRNKCTSTRLRQAEESARRIEFRVRTPGTLSNTRLIAGSTGFTVSAVVSPGHSLFNVTHKYEARSLRMTSPKVDTSSLGLVKAIADCHVGTDIIHFLY